jgi:signal transduction histidine kinase
MKAIVTKTLSDRYLAALQTHLEKVGAQASLTSAHELGSQALAEGLETLDLAKIHDQALAALVLPGCTASKRDDMTTHAAVFFTEANLPIESTHRIALETGASLKRLNAALAQHTLHLADSDRKLKLHAANRKTTEAALKANELASSQLLKESRLLEKHLRDMTRKILSASEEQRKKMSLQLQDEIAQTLLGIHVRLLSLKAEATANQAGLAKEIATTQQLVEASVKTINQFAREFGISHEN